MTTILRPLDFGAVPLPPPVTGVAPPIQPLATRQNNSRAIQAMIDAATFQGQEVDFEGGPFVVSKIPGQTYAFRDHIGLRWHFSGGGTRSPQLAMDGTFAPNDAIMLIEPDITTTFTIMNGLVENFSCTAYDEIDGYVVEGWPYVPTNPWCNYNGDCLKINIPNGAGVAQMLLDGGTTFVGLGWGLNIQGTDGGASMHHSTIQNWSTMSGIRANLMGDSNTIQHIDAWGIDFSNQSGAGSNEIYDYQSASMTRQVLIVRKASKLRLGRLNTEQKGWRGAAASAIIDLSQPDATLPMGHISLEDISVANQSGIPIGSLVVLQKMSCPTIDRLSMYATYPTAYGLNIGDRSVTNCDLRGRFTVDSSGNIANPIIDGGVGTTGNKVAVICDT